MAGQVKDISGHRFGMLTAMNKAPKRGDHKNGCIRWYCLCDCGMEVTVNGNSLRTGNSKSCGCTRRK